MGDEEVYQEYNQSNIGKRKKYVSKLDVNRYKFITNNVRSQKNAINY